MAGLLKKLHWILIVIAIMRLGFSYYESLEDHEQRDLTVVEARSELAKQEKIKIEIKKYLGNIENEKSRIERVALEIEKAQQLLPSELSDTENINLLSKMAEDVNINEKSITPEAEDVRGFYIARKYRFKAKATYLQFLIMFEKISESKRILNVGELMFRKIEQPQRSKFQIINGEFVLEAYKYNTKFKEDRGFSEIDKQFQDPSDMSQKGKNKKNKSGGSDEAG